MFFGECSSKATSLEGSKLTPVAISLLGVGRFPSSSSSSSSSDFDPSVSWENSLERRKERKKGGGGGAPRFRGFSKKSVDFSAWGFTLTFQFRSGNCRMFVAVRASSNMQNNISCSVFLREIIWGHHHHQCLCHAPAWKISSLRRTRVEFFGKQRCVCVAKKRWMPSTTPYARCSKWHTPFSFIYLL